MKLAFVSIARTLLSKSLKQENRNNGPHGTNTLVCSKWRYRTINWVQFYEQRMGVRDLVG
jgi:hypothetical protein